MGRRKQSPEEQARRGYPGRRRKHVEAEAKARAGQHTPEDEILSSLDIEGLRPPARFAQKRYADQLAIWRTLLPRLKVLARASVEFQAPLAAYCDAVVRYNRAVEELEEKGYTSEVATVAGGTMLRVNPAEKIRGQALAEVLTLSERFGFTPRDSWALMIDQRKLVSTGGQAQLPGLVGESENTPARVDPIGSMDSLDSAFPGAMN